MPSVLCRAITRRNPFQVEKVPWIARQYVRPFERWDALGRQALFGAPNFFLFLSFQKLWPFRCRGVFRYRLNQAEKRIAFNARNTQFQALYSRRFVLGYEPQATALVDLLVPPSGVFYDIGSNWGWFSLSLASRPDFRGSIHAFEPFPPSQADLRDVVRQAGLEDVIHCHELALSDQSGVASMHLPDHFQSGQATLDDAGKPGEGNIQTAALDSLSLDPPAMMKIDVEGNEPKVFRGAERVLSEHQPMILFESGHSPAAVGQTLDPLLFLDNLGYQFFYTAWLRNEGNHAYLAHDDEHFPQQPNEILALVPFDVAERFSLRCGNVFACHRDQTDRLDAVFERRSTEK